MLLVDSTFTTRGFGGIAQDNRDFVTELRKFFDTFFLYDANVVVENAGDKNLHSSMKEINARSLVLNKTIKMLEWQGDYYQTHLTGLKYPNKNGRVFLRLHDIFPITNPEWFTWQGKRIFNIAANGLSSNTILICNSQTTQSAAQTNPLLSKFESLVVPCKTMRIDDSYVPCNTCPYCLRGFPASDFLLAVGTIEPRKNYEYLIDAWEACHVKSDFNRLVIVGRPGWKSKNIQKRIKQNQTIIWLSPCDFGLQQIFLSASGFISASFAEGFDIPSVFADRLGIPSAMSSIEVHKELCPRAQFYFNPNSKVEIALAITNLKASGKRLHLNFTSKSWEDDFRHLTERIGLQSKC
jgi:glycosyltransferase involved in cell wall biosynthesis